MSDINLNFLVDQPPVKCTSSISDDVVPIWVREGVPGGDFLQQNNDISACFSNKLVYPQVNTKEVGFENVIIDGQNTIEVQPGESFTHNENIDIVHDLPVCSDVSMLPVGDFVVFTAPITESGNCVDVFNSCYTGTCTCVHVLGGVISQLLPCRFASHMFKDNVVVKPEYWNIFQGITDGYKVVDSEVASYRCSNYSSILIPEAKNVMDGIIARELEEGMISISHTTPTCIHSLGAVPKADGLIRPVTDCSRPHDLSVNDHCSSLVEEFSYSSVSDVVDMLDRYDYMAVIDIKSAYRAVPIYPKHRTYLGFQWELDGELTEFHDNRLCFGLRTGPCYFNAISCFIADVLKEKGIRMVNYLDDFITLGGTIDECLSAQNTVINLLRHLGFYVSWNKVTSPSRVTTYLGIQIDSEKMELSLPQGKLDTLRSILSKHISARYISKKNLESLNGLVSHCAQVTQGGRTYCRRFYNLQKELNAKRLKRILIPSYVRADLKWWNDLCLIFNGVCTFKRPSYYLPMISDSSFMGFGVYLGNDWALGTWSEDHQISMKSDCVHIVAPPTMEKLNDKNINVYELYPILVGLRRWGEKFRGRTVIAFTDNTQVLYMLRKGSSTNRQCLEWLKEIFWLCVVYDIEVITKYVSTESNLVADVLSRLLYAKTFRVAGEILNSSGFCCIHELLYASRNLVESSKEQRGRLSPTLSSPFHTKD